MSDPLRVALVAEGPTDHIVLEAGLNAILKDRPFVLTLLQPERSAAFNGFGQFGGGWSGVYRWCQQAVNRSGGAIQADILFASYDILIVHVDADVAEKRYSDAGIIDSVEDLPCAQPCPPPFATTNSLRAVLLRWLRAADVPPNTVLCTPSANTEAWVLAALYPEAAKAGIECRKSPESLLVSKPAQERLVRKKGDGYDKRTERYRDRSKDIYNAWPSVRKRCSEAERFSTEFQMVIASLENKKSRSS